MKQKPLWAGEIFELKPVVQGVYIVIAQQDTLDSNAAVVLLSDDVLVVDTHARPSAAKVLIDQIKTVTRKRVRYVVNTHFHWDHYQGNSAYLNASSGDVEIISSESTLQSIKLRGIPRVKHEIATLPHQIATLRDELGRVSDLELRKSLNEDLRLKELYFEELEGMELEPPSLTFQQELTLGDKEKTVHMLWLGRGHTEGDIIVHLPEDGVVITGDLLHAYMPWMADCYPYDWIETLEWLEKLDFEYVIPGHGDVLKGKDQCKLWRSYLADLMTETTEVFAEGASSGQAGQEVAARLRPRYSRRFPPGRYSFDRFIEGNIEKAYRVVAGWL